MFDLRFCILKSTESDGTNKNLKYERKLMRLVFILSMGNIIPIRRRNMNLIRLEDILSDDEITIFPDSSAVLDITNRTMSVNVTSENGGTTFYGNEIDERRSVLYMSWRRTENVFYFAAGTVILVIVMFCTYFLYNFLVLKRGSGRADRFGGRWTRLMEG